MITERVDFHAHYEPLFKDTAFKVLDIAKSKGVVAIGLLARDMVHRDYADFVDYGRKIGIDVIPAVESLAIIDEERVDLICLGFDINNKNLKVLYGQEEQRVGNVKMAAIQVKFLQESGYSFEQLEKDNQVLFQRILSGESVEKAIYFCEIIASNELNKNKIESEKLNNELLWKNTYEQCSKYPNYLNSPRKLDGKFLCSLYFNVGKSGYIYLREKIDAIQIPGVDVISTVHSAGGVVLYSSEGNFKDEHWSKLKKIGVDGIMGWHADKLGLNKGKLDIPVEVIKDTVQTGLLVLGGSDYQEKDWEVGTGNGKMFISTRRYLELLDYVNSKNGGEIPWLK